MSLSAPRIVFGIHSISPYSRADHLPYGILKVIGSASLSLQAAVEQLYGGSSRFAWAAESKTIATEMTCKVKAYPGFLFQLWLGATVTDNAAEASASASTLTNFKGSSVKSATTGIASVSVLAGSEADVKFGKFVLKATDATHVDVYLASDLDIDRGTDGVYQSDLLKITASPLAIATTTDVNIPSFGLKLTGGSGTIALVAGDTATFSSRPINSGSSDIAVGKDPTSIPAFGSILLAQKRATAEMFEIEAYNCIGSGLPIPMDEFAFSVTELKVTCLYDSVQNRVFDIRTVVPTTFS